MLKSRSFLTDIMTAALLCFCVIFSFFYYFKLNKYYFKTSEKRISVIFRDNHNNLSPKAELSVPYPFKYGTAVFHRLKDTDKGLCGELTISGEYRFIHRIAPPKIIIIKTDDFSMKGTIIDDCDF